MKPNGKRKRQDTIAGILSESTITHQEDLLQRLSEKGFELTQATLSRDFREMKVAKTPDAEGNYVYRLPAIRLPESSPKKHGLIASFLRQGKINIEFGEQFSVIRTPAGYAKGIAGDIDANNIPGIMATVAGEDTILVILREHADKAQIVSDLKTILS